MKSRIKVALVGEYPIDDRSIDGGVQAVIYYLATALKNRREIDLHVITYTSTVSSEQVVAKDKIQHHLLPKHRFGRLSGYYLYARDFEKCLQDIRPDVIHAQGAFVEGYVAVKSKYPSVITFHGMIGEDAKYKTKLSQKLRLKLQSITTEQYCVRHSNCSILISPYVAEHYGNRLRGSVHYIPNPIDDSFYEVRRNEDSNRILFAGKIIPRKGILDLINACHIVRKNHECRLILAGSQEDTEFVAQVKDLIERHRLNDSVSLVGLLTEDAVLEEFSRAALLVLPSYQETAPMVIQQAMAAGIPVIATRICGVPYQVIDGATGLLYEPHDVDALARHISTLLNNDSLRSHMGREARTKADAEYRASKVAEATIELYREIAK